MITSQREVVLARSRRRPSTFQRTAQAGGRPDMTSMLGVRVPKAKEKKKAHAGFHQWPTTSLA